MRKNVGGTNYTLSYTGEVVPGCLHNCVYHKDGELNGKFCFERGNQSVSFKVGENKLAVNHSINMKQRSGSYQYYHGYWGNWGVESDCPDGSFVYGYRLQSEPILGPGLFFDDTAINSIGMRCRKPHSYKIVDYIYSRRGSWGNWGTSDFCPGYNNPVVGFDVLMEPKQGSGDDTAVNAIDLYCKDGQMLSASRKTTWGSWTKKYMCPSGEAVGGLQTRVESNQYFGDDTALNGIGIFCRPYPGNNNILCILSVYNVFPLVDGSWGGWQSWSSCSKTCGRGSTSRRRTCSGPFYGGRKCNGDSQQYRACSIKLCPSKYSYHYYISKKIYVVFPLVDGSWEGWESWSSCSKTCGGGSSSRRRACYGPFHGGRKCYGDSKEYKDCSTKQCPSK